MGLGLSLVNILEVVSVLVAYLADLSGLVENALEVNSNVGVAVEFVAVENACSELYAEGGCAVVCGNDCELVSREHPVVSAALYELNLCGAVGVGDTLFHGINDSVLVELVGYGTGYGSGKTEINGVADSNYGVVCEGLALDNVLVNYGLYVDLGSEVDNLLIGLPLAVLVEGNGDKTVGYGGNGSGLLYASYIVYACLYVNSLNACVCGCVLEYGNIVELVPLDCVGSRESRYGVALLESREYCVVFAVICTLLYVD